MAPGSFLFYHFQIKNPYIYPYIYVNIKEY